MSRFAARERLSDRVARLLLETSRELVERLDLTIELEAVVRHASLEDERRALALRVERQLRLRDVRELPHEIVRDLCAFDRRAGHAELVGEITELAGDGSPGAAHASLGDACLVSRRGLLVDHEREWHVPGDELLEPPQRVLAGVRHPLRYGTV